MAAALCIVEFNVPVEVVAPALRCVTQPDCDAYGWGRFGPLRDAAKMHPGFGRCSPSLFSVASHATGNNILPVLPAALGDRHDMIEGQLVGGKLVTAVLTLVIVASVNIRPRKWHVIEAPLDLDVTQQAND